MEAKTLKEYRRRNIKIFLLFKKDKIKFSKIAEMFKVSEDWVKRIYYRTLNSKTTTKELLDKAIERVEKFKERSDYDYYFRINSPRYNILIEEADHQAYMYQKLYA